MDVPLVDVLARRVVSVMRKVMRLTTLATLAVTIMLNVTAQPAAAWWTYWRGGW